MLQEAALDALVKRIVARLEDDKAEDVVVLDILGKAAFADRMVIASGLSGRQLKAMAEHLIDLLEADGLRVQAEGLGSSDWVLLDVGDVVIHLFRPEMRAHYALEKMWGVSLPGDEIRPGEVRRA
ncbi:MAG: ribosome silencing factor [Elioraea sp.]|nr:ribosome silencing factor [Elioraea sp.]